MKILEYEKNHIKVYYESKLKKVLAKKNIEVHIISMKS